MKNIMLAMLAVMLSACATSGMVASQATQEQLNPTKVYDVPGAKKELIYDQSMRYIAENFRSSKAVLEYQDKSTGTIIGNGVIPYPCDGFDCVGKGQWRVRFTMKLEAKDDKFRASFSNLTLLFDLSEVPVMAGNDAAVIDAKLMDIGNNLSAYIQKKPEENW
jgi:hypothetical protein